FNLPLSAANQLMDLQQGYRIFSDNTGAGSHNSRLWLDGPEGGEVVVGPRSGPPLDQIRLRTNTTRIEGNCLVTGSLSISGSVSANTHAATKEYVDNAVGSRVPTSRTITAGTGLTGGGDLTANRTLSVDSTVWRN